MNIKRRPYMIDGKTIHISGRNEQEVAEKYAKYVLEASKEMMLTELVKLNVPKTDFCEYANKWMVEKAEHKLRSGTATNYRGHIKLITSHFQGMTLQGIDRDLIQGFLDKFAHQSESTTRHKRIILQQIFEWGIEDGLILQNPAKSNRIEVKGKKKQKRSAIPEEDYRKVLECIVNVDKPTDRSLLALTAFTGMRRGEALALKWEDIDWKEGIVHVTKAIAFKGNQPYVKPPKSKSGNRSLPLIPELAEVLKPLQQLSGYIAGRDTENPLTETMVKNCLNRIRKQSGLQDYGFHNLRHTYATVMARDPNVTSKTLQTLMGHADISTTFNMYAETEDKTIINAGYSYSQYLAQ